MQNPVSGGIYFRRKDAEGPHSAVSAEWAKSAINQIKKNL